MKIELRNLTKRFEKETILDNVSLSLPENKRIAVVGINGAGKTTLLNLLYGLYTPNKGHVYMDGEFYHRDKLEMRQRILYLPEYPAMSTEWYPSDYLLETFRAFGQEPDIEKTATLFKRFSLEGCTNKLMIQLSRGQIYKVALATALLLERDLYLLDEPYASGMDPRGISVLNQYLENFARSGKTIFFTTQLLELAIRHSDHLLVITDGKIREIADPSSMNNRTQEEIEQMLGASEKEELHESD